jgi:hypothetical protein
MRIPCAVLCCVLQMLLRGANAVGYTSYADNVVNEFCRQAKVSGVDIFRIFDSLNYIDNLKFGIDSVTAAGGIAEGTICYTGDLTNPARTRVSGEVTPLVWPVATSSCIWLCSLVHASPCCYCERVRLCSVSDPVPAVTLLFTRLQFQTYSTLAVPPRSLYCPLM